MIITVYRNGQEVGKVTGWDNVRIGAPDKHITIYKGSTFIHSNDIPM